jgi:phosphatidate cytidylyltransferase
MKRLLTAAVGVPLALAAIFRLPGWAFFLVTAALLTGAAWEFSRLARPAAPRAPWGAVPILVPVAAAGLALGLRNGARVDGFHALGLGALAAIGVGVIVLAARTPIEQALPALGGLSFAVPYFAVPIAALYRLQQHDPWVLFLLLAIVWLGDTAAYYVGTTWGRHRLAPVVSPKKSWEGAVAGLGVSLVATVIWGAWRLGEIGPELIAIGLVTAVASQLGDLVESLVKRSAGVKDSGDLLPGHGGLLDRMDAMLFAAPVLLLMLRWLGWEGAS